MSHRITVFDAAEELGRAVAAEIAPLVEEAARRGERFVLGCPGGRTPVSTYRALAEEFAARDADLRHLVIAMMDDYVVPSGSGWEPVPETAHNSCRRFARVEIQGVLNAAVRTGHRIPDENVWLPDPADPAAYERLLDEQGGIDYFILASGAGDGHVAFNPPGTLEDSSTRIVELAEQTRRDNLATFPDYRGLDDVPLHGVTVGVGTIARLSKRAVMIAVGEGKREAVRRLLAGDGYDPSWPATVYRTMPGARLFADADAASGLS